MKNAVSGFWTLTRHEFASAIAKGHTLVDFVASCCPPCASRERQLVDLHQSVGGRLSVARVDLDESPDLMRTLGVVVLPALVLFQDGVPRRTHIGDLISEQLSEFVEHDLLPSSFGL